MKRRVVNLPYHDMLELVTSHFEVSPKVVHDSDVISEGLSRGKVGEPATLSTFRKVNPAACRGHRGHDLGVFLEAKKVAAWAWGGGGGRI